MATKELTIIVDDEVLNALVVADLRLVREQQTENMESPRDDDIIKAFDVVLSYYGFPDT